MPLNGGLFLSAAVANSTGGVTVYYVFSNGRAFSVVSKEIPNTEQHANLTYVGKHTGEPAQQAVRVDKLLRICLFSKSAPNVPVLSIDTVGEYAQLPHSSLSVGVNHLSLALVIPALMWDRDFRGFTPLFRLDWEFATDCWQGNIPKFAKLTTYRIATSGQPNPVTGSTVRNSALDEVIASSNRRWHKLPYFPAEIQERGQSSYFTWYQPNAIAQVFGLTTGRTANKIVFDTGKRKWTMDRPAWQGDVALEFIPVSEDASVKQFRVKMSRILVRTELGSNQYEISCDDNLNIKRSASIPNKPPEIDDWNVPFISCCQADETIKNAHLFPIKGPWRSAWIAALELGDGAGDAGGIVRKFCKDLGEFVAPAVASIDGRDDPSFAVEAELPPPPKNGRYTALRGFWLNDPHVATGSPEWWARRIEPVSPARGLLRFGSFRALTGAPDVYANESEQTIAGVTIRLPLLETLDGTRIAYNAVLKVSAQKIQLGGSILSIDPTGAAPIELNFAFPGTRKKVSEVDVIRTFRFDSLDLTLGAVPGPLRLALMPKGKEFGYLISANGESSSAETTPWVLPIAGGDPNGTARGFDGERGVFEPRRLSGDQLIFTELSDGTFVPKGTLEVLERATSFRGRVLSARLKTGDQQEKETTVAIGVIRSEPFFVGRVEIKSLTATDTSGEIATWHNLSGAPTGWKFRAPKGEVAIVFPPQGIGEATLKKFDEIEVGVGKVAQARLTPPAKLIGKPAYAESDFGSDFVAVPWDPIAVFGSAGQRAPGAKVVSIDAEFTYGLRVKIEATGVRAAEIGSTKGAPPFVLTGDSPAWGAPVLEKFSRGVTGDVGKSIREKFQDFRRNWAARIAAHRSRVALIELWRDRPGETLRLGLRPAEVAYELRAEADVRRPVAVPPPGFPRSEFSTEYRGAKSLNPDRLPGGIEWGFESTAIYEKVLESPVAFRGEIAGVRLSARGGSAWQKAEFDNGLTRIYATVVDGRTHVYTVERIGRIAGLWNRAKHVLQYERSAGQSDQMLGNTKSKKKSKKLTKAGTEPYLGRAALRKVAEYVELLEDVRTYPDIGGTEVALGPLRGSEFKSRIIPVNGAWGGDYGDAGWRVPLWKPGQPGVYAQKPQILLRLACDPALGRDVAGQILNPDRLYFYTSVRETTPETDRWRAKAGIDFPNVAAAPPPTWGVPFGAGREREPVPPGLEDFTLLVELPDGAQANLNAGRSGAPMGARLRSVSIARGRPLSSIEVKVALNGIADVNHRALAELAATRPIDNWIHTLTDGKGAFTDRTKAVKAAVEGLNAKIDNFKDYGCQRLKKRLGDALIPLKKRLIDERDKVLDRLDPFATNLDALKKEAEVELDALGARIGTEIRGLDFGRTELRRVMAAIDLLESQARRGIEGPANALRAIIDEFAQFGSKPTVIGALCERAGRETDGIRKDLHAGLDALREALVPLANQLPEGALKTIAANAIAAIDACRGAVEGFATTVSDAVKKLPAADPEAWNVVVSAAKATIFFAQKQFDQAIDAVGTALRAPLIKLDEDVEKFVNSSCENVATAIKAAQGLIDKVADKNGWTKAKETVRSDTDKALIELEKATNVELDRQLAKGGDLCKLLSPFGAATLYLKGILEEIDKLKNPDDVRKFATEIDAKFGALEREARRECATLIEQVNPKTLERVLYDGDGALRMFRALGDPPNVPNLEFKLPNMAGWKNPAGEVVDRIAYYIDEATNWVAMTPVFGIVKDAGNSLPNLGLHFPTIGLSERLLAPDALLDFQVPDLFRNLGGLDIGDGLFKYVKLPDDIKDNVKVSHGFDKETKTGWLQADVNVAYSEPIEVFNLSPVRISIRNAKFSARARADAALAGTSGLKERWGRISGDWVLEAGGQPVLTFRSSTLSCDESGTIAFDTSTDRIETAPALLFLQRMTEKFKKSADEAGFGVIENDQREPIGIRKGVDLPIPPMVQGAWGVSGLHFGASMALFWKDPNGGKDDFSLEAALNIGSPRAPFTITVFVLGGCGWVRVETRYRPATGKIATEIDVALGASAAVGFNTGGFYGCVQLYIAVKANYATDRGGDVILSFVFGMNGSLTVIGLIDVDVAAVLEASLTPDNRVIGHGTLSAEVRISRFFSKSVSTRFTQQLT
jgi:hypothetical protein